MQHTPKRGATLKFTREYLSLIGWSIHGTKSTGYRIHRKGIRNDPWSYETDCLEDAVGTAELSNRKDRLVRPV